MVQSNLMTNATRKDEAMIKAKSPPLLHLASTQLAHTQPLYEIFCTKVGKYYNT
jgi:hypothetical protein